MAIPVTERNEAKEIPSKRETESGCDKVKSDLQRRSHFRRVLHSRSLAPALLSKLTVRGLQPAVSGTVQSLRKILFRAGAPWRVRKAGPAA